MGRASRFLTAIGIVLTMLSSCRAISSLVHDGQVVAKVGKHRLYKSDVDRLIPNGASAEDSLQISMMYINSWVSDLVFMDIAESQLSKEDLDVSKELEEYRRTLLKYRYEQLYVNERLDTAVSYQEIESYYSENKDNFVLTVPAVKARFLRIQADSPNLELIKDKMSSSDERELAEADSLSYFSAEMYTDYGGGWVDMVTLAKDFGTDYGTLLSRMKKSMIEIEDGYGKVNVAYIAGFLNAGAVPPMEYCSQRIKDIIISLRRQALLSGLERDLIEDARARGKFVIL